MKILNLLDKMYKTLGNEICNNYYIILAIRMHKTHMTETLLIHVSNNVYTPFFNQHLLIGRSPASQISTKKKTRRRNQNNTMYQYKVTSCYVFLSFFLPQVHLREKETTKRIAVLKIIMHIGIYRQIKQDHVEKRD